MKTQTVYKVVRKSNNELISACVYRNQKLFISYKLNQTSYPKIGKIFVFDSLSNAREFASNNFGRLSYYTIFKGTATNTYKPKYICHVGDNLQLFWKLKAQHKNPEYKVDINTHSWIPDGTLLCDSFTPTEIIKG